MSSEVVERLEKIIKDMRNLSDEEIVRKIKDAYGINISEVGKGDELILAACIIVLNRI